MIKISPTSYVENSTLEGKNKIGSRSELYDCEMGRGTYLGQNVILSKTKIGRYCAIGNRIYLNIGQHPTRKIASIHPAFYSPDNPSIKGLDLNYSKKLIFTQENQFTKDGYSLEIGNDVWIGNDVRLMEGVKIADGAIIASGSLVIRDVPPYEIHGGIPAKKLRSRFTDLEIEKLIELKWWEKDEKWLVENSSKFEDINFLIKDDKCFPN